MATIVNDRDKLLQAESPRVTSGGASKGIVLSASKSAFDVSTSGTGSPSTITLTAALIGITGAAVSFSTSPTTTLSVSGNVATLAFSNMTTNSVAVTASVTDAGVTYTNTQTITKLMALGGLATKNAVDLANDVIGYLSSGKVTGLGALSTLNYINLGGSYVTGTIDARTQVNYLGALAYANAVAADQIGAGQLAAGVAYIGDLNAGQIKTGALTSASIAITGDAGWALNVVPGQAQVSYRTLNGYRIQASYGAAPGSPTISATGYAAPAILGVNNSGQSTGHGVRGQSTAYATWTPPTGISGGGATPVTTSTVASGLVGCASGYDFYAEGGGTNYGPFTGAHDVLVALSDVVEVGDIVVDVECIARNGLSNTIFRVARSSSPCQKAAVGVLVLYSGMLSDHVPAAFMLNRSVSTSDVGPSFDAVAIEEISPDYDAVKNLYLRGAANALGEGQINVCGEGGNISPGDWIVTSSIPGKGMRQSDDLLRNYTVARAREGCTFTSISEVKTIACIYVCG